MPLLYSVHILDAVVQQQQPQRLPQQGTTQLAVAIQSHHAQTHQYDHQCRVRRQLHAEQRVNFLLAPSDLFLWPGRITLQGVFAIRRLKKSKPIMMLTLLVRSSWLLRWDRGEL
jgi:hypothetical protein